MRAQVPWSLQSDSQPHLILKRRRQEGNHPHFTGEQSEAQGLFSQ